MKNKKFFMVILLTISLVLSMNSFVHGYNLNSYKDKEVYNILLIGIDGYEEVMNRADAMIILTIDNENKALKLSSLARDTLVDIPGKGYDKLNHSFAYGGINLLIKTINNNFELNIQDYAIVDFKGFIDIINILDGVEVNIEDREINGLNKVINACYSLNYKNKGNNIEYITSSGNIMLNGYQALAYCRLRKIDDCFHRDSRQRKILESLANKLSKVSIFKYPQLIQTILKYVDVNISTDKILNLAIKSRELANYDIKQLQFPHYKYRRDGKLKKNSQYVIEWDKDKNIEMLHDFIYN